MKKFLITACLSLSLLLSHNAFAKDKGHKKAAAAPASVLQNTQGHYAEPGSIEETTNVVINLTNRLHDDYRHAVAACWLMQGNLRFNGGEYDEQNGMWHCIAKTYLYTVQFRDGYSDIVLVDNEPVVSAEKMIRAYGQPTKVWTRPSKGGGQETISLWDKSELSMMEVVERSDGTLTLSIAMKQIRQYD